MAPPSNKSRWHRLIDSLPMLHAYVCRLIGNGERAEEVLQEVSLRMLATEGPDNAERYAAWSRGVARHVIAREWRRRRRALAEQPLEDDVIDEMSDGIDQEAHLDARDWIARIADDIDSDGLELLFRRYVLQETGKELADEMEQSPAAIRMRLMRLRSSASALAPRP